MGLQALPPANAIALNKKSGGKWKKFAAVYAVQSQELY